MEIFYAESMPSQKCRLIHQSKGNFIGNQLLTDDSALMAPSSKKVPSQNLDSAFQTRIREVLGTESVTAFGRRCGIGEGTLRSYLNGTLPVIDKAISIADAANVNIEWLTAGRGPKQRGTVTYSLPQSTPAMTASEPVVFDDLTRLSTAIAAVQEGLHAIKRTLPPNKYAELVAAAYELLDSPSASTSNVIKFIKATA